MLSPVSTWMGDRLGTPGAVGSFLINTYMGILSIVLGNLEPG